MREEKVRKRGELIVKRLHSSEIGDVLVIFYNGYGIVISHMYIVNTKILEAPIFHFASLTTLQYELKKYFMMMQLLAFTLVLNTLT